MTESSSADRTEHCPESSTVGGPEHCRERAAEDDPRLPRVLVNSSQLPAEPARGAVWSITGAERDLDSNLIRLPPGERIDLHVRAEVDVLIHVVSGAGALLLPEGEHPLRAGDVALLPRRSRRGFRTGADGLEYLTVHRRRQSLQIGTRR